ncbi:hypothetical protein D623_10017300 [Myotis brandtii]|uniref:Uncharacterized protein n=1 Tax=Myotis brandtii TaxID=109478 RepID=S7PN68_MYOBR|nr:hypothetical protein D623_10017300 [Myotis brandtii]
MCKAVDMLFLMGLDVDSSSCSAGFAILISSIIDICNGGEDVRPRLGESTRDKPERFEVQPWKYVGCYGSKQ